MSSTRSDRRHGGTRLVHAGAALALCGAVMVLFACFVTRPHNARSVGVDDLAAERSWFGAPDLRVDGALVPGTLRKREGSCAYQFSIVKRGVEMPVHYGGCMLPDTFSEQQAGGLGVVVEGDLLADGTFDATTVIAKCPTKYMPRWGEREHGDTERAPTL